MTIELVKIQITGKADRTTDEVIAIISMGQAEYLGKQVPLMNAACQDRGVGYRFMTRTSKITLLNDAEAVGMFTYILMEGIK